MGRVNGQNASAHNIFELEGGEGDEWGLSVRVDFEPVLALDLEMEQQKMVLFSIIPVFNADGRFYSPAFVNPYEVEEADGKLHTDYHTRVKQSGEIARTRIVTPLSFRCCRSRARDSNTATSAGTTTKTTWTYPTPQSAHPLPLPPQAPHQGALR